MGQWADSLNEIAAAGSSENDDYDDPGSANDPGSDNGGGHVAPAASPRSAATAGRQLPVQCLGSLGGYDASGVSQNHPHGTDAASAAAAGTNDLSRCAPQRLQPLFDGGLVWSLNHPSVLDSSPRRGSTVLAPLRHARALRYLDLMFVDSTEGSEGLMDNRMVMDLAELKRLEEVRDSRGSLPYALHPA